MILQVDAADTGDAWWVRIEADRMHTTRGRDDADCTVSGTAADLYLLLWNRAGPADVRVSGDAGLLGWWRDHVRVRLS